MTHPYASIAAELTRTLAAREHIYPARVAKGTMTMAESNRGIQMARTWLEDCHRYRTAYENETARNLQHAATIARAQAAKTMPEALAITASLPPFETAQMLAQDGRRFPAAVLGAFPWPTRWRAIQEELADRARLYPGHVARGQLTQLDADMQIERLTAMLHVYDDMQDWRPGNGTNPTPPHARHQTPQGAASFDEAAPYLTAIMLRRRWITPEQLQKLWPNHAPAERKELSA